MTNQQEQRVRTMRVVIGTAGSRRRVAAGVSPADPAPDAVWVDPTPEQMAADTIAGFAARFEWVLDDLRALVSGRPILAEGWRLPPASWHRCSTHPTG